MKTYPFARGLLLVILCLCLPLFVSNAGDALAQKQSASDVDNLREMLKDKDPNIRRNAAQALGHMGPGAKAAVPALTEATQSKNYFVRQSAVAALGKIAGTH